MNESQFKSSNNKTQKSQSRVPKYSDKFKDLLNKSQIINVSKQKINQPKICDNNSNPTKNYQYFYQNFKQKNNKNLNQDNNKYHRYNNDQKIEKQKQEPIQIQTPFVQNKINYQMKQQLIKDYKNYQYKLQKQVQLKHRSNQYQSVLGQYKFITDLNNKSPQNQKQHFFYRVKSIGVGAHSFVYLTQQQSTKCLYAQKAIVKAHSLNNIDQLLNQINIQYRLNHDNLISLYYFYCDQSYVYLIMQYAQQSLFNLKTKFRIFKQKQVIQILRQLLHGIGYMHRKGYVHADIKIQNIMIRNFQGRIKLCDFGYATKWKQNKKIDPNSIIGTLQYLSPQYVDSLDTGPLRDIWAIGILCFELWTGKNILQDLKQNQKWQKLIKPDYSVYLNQFHKIEIQQNRKSQKLQTIIKHTLCPYQQRYSAEKLLKFQFFNMVNTN